MIGGKENVALKQVTVQVGGDLREIIRDHSKNKQKTQPSTKAGRETENNQK